MADARTLMREKLEAVKNSRQSGQPAPRTIDDAQVALWVKRALMLANPHLRDSVLLLTHIVTDRMDDAPFAVRAVKSGSETLLQLIYDPDMVDAVVSSLKESGVLDNNIYRELLQMMEHELWHIVLGDPFNQELLRKYANPHEDPVWLLAVEARINDGFLQYANQMVYPVVTLANIGIEKQAEEYADKHNFPKDWKRDLNRMYEAIYHTYDHARYRLSVKIENGKPVAIVIEQDVVENGQVVRTDRMEFPFADIPEMQGDESDRRMMRKIADNIQIDGLQYDQSTGSLRYVPKDPDAKPKFRVPWHLIRSAIGYKRSTGYNRRIGHMYPPDQTPLVNHKLAAKSIYAFIDTSGSIPDELLYQFTSVLKTSPYQVVLKYFNVQVTDEPQSGGTRFACIEEHLKDLDRYPDTVVVLTDGQDFGEPFAPEYPDRWYWIVYGDPSRIEQIGGKIIEVEVC